MATHYETQKRRAYQRLWNKLDEYLSAMREAVLAISGGPDSRALLEAVATWPQRRAYRFRVVIVDHALRKEADHEARFVQQRAARLGFESRAVRLPLPASTAEHALRSARYDALFRIAREEGIKTVVTAHQGDDDAEGYLMALMGVGGGELGAAMAEIEYFDDMILCRPFLTLCKVDLLLALSMSMHTDFVRDSCDEARIGKRAFVRHEIVAELARHTPTLRHRLATFGRAQARQRSVVDKLAASLIAWRNDSASLSLEPKPDPALLTSALWQIIKYFGDGKDLRSAGTLIASIAEEVFAEEILENHAKAGLDPRLHGFNLKALSVKQYQVPGAVVFRARSEIQVRRN